MVLGHPSGNGHTLVEGRITPADLGPMASVPRNLEAEKGVLAAIMMDRGVLALDEVARLTTDHFNLALHQTVFEVIRTLESQGKGCDLVCVGEEMGRRGLVRDADDTIELSDIAGSIPHARDARHHADILHDLALRRAQLFNAEQTRDDIVSNLYTVEELRRRARAREESIEALENEELAAFDLESWPDPPDPAVFHGLAGEIVGLVEPHTEADPMAILGQLLVCFGNIVGRHCYYTVEATRHYCNLFLALVGNSARGRKGTAYNVVMSIFGSCEKAWQEDRIFTSGLSSGEGLIAVIKDAEYRREKKARQPLIGSARYEEVESDPGVDDKRALFVESEFGGMLATAAREGNVLNKVLRNAFDGIPLRSDTKNNPVRCMKPHVSAIGHVTYTELERRLSTTDISNGFANRFLWMCVKRSKLIPRTKGLSLVNFSGVRTRLGEAVEFATFQDKAIDFDHEAGELWDATYPELTSDRPGVLGEVTSRSDPLTVRVAMIYALLDSSPRIRVEHLRAALALWRYCEQSVNFIFGDEHGDPMAERIMQEARKALPEGLSKTRLSKLFGWRKNREVGRTLTRLVQGGHLARRDLATDGRSREFWVAIR